VCGYCSAGKRPTAGAIGNPKFVCWCFAKGTKLPHNTQQRSLKDFGRPTAAKETPTPAFGVYFMEERQMQKAVAIKQPFTIDEIFYRQDNLIAPGFNPGLLWNVFCIGFSPNSFCYKKLLAETSAWKVFVLKTRLGSRHLKRRRLRNLDIYCHSKSYN
jgi:hypothetical protein